MYRSGNAAWHPRCARADADCALCVYPLFAYIGVALPLGLYLTFPAGLGAKGMWMAFVIALVIPAILFHIRFNRQYKKLKIKNYELKIENNEE